MTAESLRQRCAKYIMDNPGCALTEIMAGTQSIYSRGTKAVCKLLKTMVDAGELTREGTLKHYTYTVGPNIMEAINGVKTPPKKPVSGRKGVKNSNVMQIKQLWVRAGEYTIEPGDTRYNSLWSYADSFVTDCSQVFEI